MSRRIYSYIHSRDEWPNLLWNEQDLATPLAAIRHRQGLWFGHLSALGFPIQQDAILKTLTEDALKTSAIEGERLDASEVRSSLARRLGLEFGGAPASRNVEGLVEMLLDATRNYDQPLTQERLYGWQAALFPTGRSGMTRIITGAWREGPMQVISGAIGHEKIHYEAPEANRLDSEMERFLTWFNAPSTIDGVLRAALAHFWFVTIHPFEDGNGRIARAIADMALARSEQSSRRFYSMSGQIQKIRADYYDILETSQRGPLDITPWMQWFLRCLDGAIQTAQDEFGAVTAKARFWENLVTTQINTRQRAALNVLLDGLEPDLSSSQWAQLTKTSPDTALRDITDLVEKRILIRSPRGGRSTRYRLAPFQP